MCEDSSESPPALDPTARLGCGWTIVFAGAVALIGSGYAAWAPIPEPEWRPHSEFGYGPTLPFPFPVYPITALVVVAAIYFAIPRTRHALSWPLSIALGMVAVALVALLFRGTSWFAPVHAARRAATIATERAACDAGSAEACGSLVEHVPYAERRQVLEQWCDLDAPWGCAALGNALYNTVDGGGMSTDERARVAVRTIEVLAGACEHGRVDACRLASAALRDPVFGAPDEARADAFWRMGEAIANPSR